MRVSAMMSVRASASARVCLSVRASAGCVRVRGGLGVSEREREGVGGAGTCACHVPWPWTSRPRGASQARTCSTTDPLPVLPLSLHCPSHSPQLPPRPSSCGSASVCTEEKRS